MKNITLVCFLIFSLANCTEEKKKDISITIENGSLYHFDRIDISTNAASQTFKNVRSGQTVTRDMAVPYLGKQSGRFLLKGYVKGRKMINGTFGYYPQPGQIKSDYHVLLNKELLIKEK
jgi:hypothetical protein